MTYKLPHSLDYPVYQNTYVSLSTLYGKSDYKLMNKEIINDKGKVLPENNQLVLVIGLDDNICLGTCNNGVWSVTPHLEAWYQTTCIVKWWPIDNI